MADPHDRDGTGEFAAKLHGALLKFIHEDDRDFLIEHEDPPPDKFAQMVPVKPIHAPRCLMTTAIYEMLCQAYGYVNSIGYRSRTDDPARTRELHSLTMTFPSGMFQPEKERYKRQCEKAIAIFSRTLGKASARQAPVDFQHRRGQCRPSDVHLGGTEDVGPGPPPLVFCAGAGSHPLQRIR